MADASLVCTADKQDGVLVATILVAQIREAKTAYELRDQILSLMQEGHPRDIVFDLAKVGFVGSVGFLAFLGVRRKLASGRIVLCNMSEPIRDMFAVCRLIQTESNAAAPFEVAATKEAALERLKI
jgi:anti-anti-sigma factor